MALAPTDSQHALQIQAGITGRRRGHEFEFELAEFINASTNNFINNANDGNVFFGDPAKALVKKSLLYNGWSSYDHVDAIALGALATAEEGKQWLEVHGIPIKACKSDILITFYKGEEIQTVGVSVKQCNNKTPTNAQLYFTTATAFLKLLDRNGICTSENALIAMKQFCGDDGFRPLDDPDVLQGRLSDPRRFFWEEVNQEGRLEMENIFIDHQNTITGLLLQKAYLDDPFMPEILLHKTKEIPEGEQEYALYSINELIQLSRKYCGFEKRSYSVRKGQHKDPAGVTHEAPRFGIVQMQRGGQRQHPTQLQFNLQAGYFYKI